MSSSGVPVTVRADNLIRGSDQHSCGAGDPAGMITVHVPAVGVSPDHLASRVAAAARREETAKTTEILILRPCPGNHHPPPVHTVAGCYRYAVEEESRSSRSSVHL